MGLHADDGYARASAQPKNLRIDRTTIGLVQLSQSIMLILERPNKKKVHPFP